MGDWLQENKEWVIRCPVCGYASKKVFRNDCEDRTLYRCLSVFRHLFWVTDLA